MNDYNCSNCPYCQPTNNFMTRWCTFWKKVTYITDGCFRETTILDDDYDDMFDEDY